MSYREEELLMPEGRWSRLASKTYCSEHGRETTQREIGLMVMDLMKTILTSLKSWSHIAARQLYSMELEERQLIIFIHHLGIEHVGVVTFDPQDKGRYSQQSDFST